MAIKLTRRHIVQVILYLYVLVCTFFPLDTYNIKIYCFFVLMLLAIPDFVNALQNKKMSAIMTLGIVYTFLLIAMSIINNGNLYNSISIGYVPLLILILVPIIENNIDYEKILMKFLTLEAVFTVFIAFLDIIGVININDSTQFRTFFYQYGVGYLGKSSAYSSYYRIFLKCSPLFIYLLDYAWKEKKKVILGISILALFFSGTRANFWITCLFVAWKIIFDMVHGKKRKYIFGFIVIIFGLILSSKILNVFTNMMNTTGSIASDTLRSGQLKGLFIELRKPHVLFMGAGLGTQFFDYGRMQYISGVEWSYLDLLRQIGLVLFIPFVIFVFNPLFDKNIHRSTRMAHFCYLIVSFTNPLFFSSTAFLAYKYMYYKKMQLMAT